MARYTSERAEKQIGNKFDMVLIAAQRAREINQGHRPKIATKNGAVITSLMEIEQGVLDPSIINRIGERTVRRFKPIR